jgi:ABC-type dipeptide/oligopeptide/nickel transport system ATPase component
MATTDEDVLAVKGLSTYFYQDQQFVRAVENVSFRIPQGGRFGLAGASGSGKTQTALAIAGLVRGTPGVIDGEIWVDGINVLEGLADYCRVERTEEEVRVEKDVQGWRRHRARQRTEVLGRRVGMVFQEPKGSLSPYFTIGEQARETVAAHFGTEAAEAYRDRIHPLLDKMQFREPERILSSYPHELSGGQSQRVMLALTLLSEPSLLIADEPTTLLDAVTELRVLEMMDALARDQEVALLLITHDLGQMADLVDRVAVMHYGSIVEEGPVSQIMYGPIQERDAHTRELRRAAARSGVLASE